MEHMEHKAGVEFVNNILINNKIGAVKLVRSLRTSAYLDGDGEPYAIVSLLAAKDFTEGVQDAIRERFWYLESVAARETELSIENRELKTKLAQTLSMLEASTAKMDDLHARLFKALKGAGYSTVEACQILLTLDKA